MAVEIANVAWTNDFDAYDLHVLAGKSTEPLRPHVTMDLFNPANGTHTPFTGGDPPGGKLQFIAEVDQTALAQQKLGFSIDKTTGVVTADGQFPPQAVFNFQIRVEATSTLTPVPTITLRIRVHLHRALAGGKVWLSPSLLHIRVGADGQRFGILAEFEDRTIGDLTYLTRSPGINWKSNDPGVTIDPVKGSLKAGAANKQALINLTLPADWGNATAEGSVETLPAWSAIPAKAVRVGKQATTLDAPDFLFLADGFAPGAEGRTAFESIVQAMVTQIRTNKSSAPLHLFDGAINFWYAWIDPVPGQDQTCSVLSDVALVPRRNNWVQGLPLAVAPPAGSTSPWAVDQMLNGFGLPVPSDANADFVAKRSLWTTQYDQQAQNHLPDGTDSQRKASRAQFDLWTALANRRLLDERNSVLGIAFGQRPKRDADVYPYMPGFNPLRTTRTHLDEFLKVLTDAADTAATPPKIGGRWGDTNGASRKFVFVLLNGARDGAAQTPAPNPNPIIAASLSTAQTMSVTNISLPASPSLELVVDEVSPPDPANGLPIDLSIDLMHEACHAFGLGDEYAYVKSEPLPAGKTGGALNLYELAPGGQLRSSNLPWNWPRISAAAAVTKQPEPLGGDRFSFSVRAGQERLFKTGQNVKVTLRPRPLVASTAAAKSCDLVVDSTAPGVVTAKRTGGSDPTTFAVGSVLFVAVRDGAGKVLTLVSKPISAFIDDKHQSLDTNVACQPDKPDDNPYQHGRNLPEALQKVRMRTLYIGAWRGGNEYQCGVFHPTGACVMREQMIPLPGHHSIEAYHFCYVCRYILVDRLDPSKHGLLDGDYFPK